MAKKSSVKKHQFSTSDEIQIIDFYRGNEHLWNTDDLNYANRPMRQSSVIQFSQKIKIPEDQIKTKWHALRSQFNRCEKNLKNRFGTALDDTSITWPHFKSLTFLQKDGDNASANSPSTSDGPHGRHDPEKDESEAEIETEKQEKGLVADGIPLKSINSTISAPASTVVTKEPIELVADDEPVKKSKKKKSKKNRSMEGAADSDPDVMFLKAAAAANIMGSNNDEATDFCRSLAHRLRIFDQDQLAEAVYQINSVVYQLYKQKK